MRSRPKVKTYLRPAIATPGSSLHVEVVLASESETPVDFVDLRLEGYERAQFGRYGSSHAFLALNARHGKRTLGVGEHRLAGRFDLPGNVPPSYAGSAGTIAYTLTVHVAIPWWPDRRQSFAIPVAPIAAPVTPTPQTIVTALEGPRGTAPFIEASFDSTTLEIGGELAGAISIANTRHSTIRGLDLVLVAVETSRQGFGSYEPRRLRWRIRDGAPEEAKPIPFRVALGREIGVDLAGTLFALRWHLEVVVDVAWGFNATLRVPVTVVPAPPMPTSVRRTNAAGRWVAPVGRERRALIWATVADKHAMINDAEQERMSASIGAIALVVQLQQRGTDGLYSVATMRWPSLGIDLHVEPRALTDLFVREIDLGSSDQARRFTVRAREAAQARAVLGEDALATLTAFEEVRIDDEGATVASRGGAATLPQLEAFVTSALVAARALAFGIARMPPPQKMTTNVAAWEAFASRLGGQLDRGSMRIRDARFATDGAEIATLWSRHGDVEGTALRVHLSAPLDAPIDPESPALSPEARDLAKAITAEARSVRLGPDMLEALVAGPLDDPASVEPLLEKIARLARASRGVPTAGPFR